jgi:hypothetical protein
MFSASDKARLVSAFVAYPTKNPLTAAQRKQQQETVLARMDEQCSLQADAHPAGSVMLAGFLTEIRAKLAAPTATAIVDDTALD